MRSGPEGTILGYTDWQGEDDDRSNIPRSREHIPPFDPLTSRSIRDNGFFPEMLRTTPGALPQRAAPVPRWRRSAAAPNGSPPTMRSTMAMARNRRSASSSRPMARR